MRLETLDSLIAELEAVDAVIEQLQRESERDAPRILRNATPLPDGVTHLHDTLTLPGDRWQALEAMKGLSWVARQLSERLRKGGRDD